MGLPGTLPPRGGEPGRLSRHIMEEPDFRRGVKGRNKESRDWWPVNFERHGLFIRLAWQSAGSYRIHDRRSGAGNGGIRFPPRINRHDNIDLD